MNNTQFTSYTKTESVGYNSLNKKDHIVDKFLKRNWLKLIEIIEKIHIKIENQFFTNFKQIESARNSISSKTSNYDFIAIPTTKKIYFKQLDEILYFESDGRYTIVHLLDGSEIVIAKNIGEYDKILTLLYVSLNYPSDFYSYQLFF